MCEYCGCGRPGEEGVRIVKPGATEESDQEHHHTHVHGPHEHSHEHDHEPHHTHRESIVIEEDILGANNLIAARNRGFFEGREVVVLNLMSSPGAGKTTLLERTIKDLSDKCPWAVIEGDQQTTMDAERIAQTGTPAIQVNTGAGCHLDARMVRDALEQLEIPNQGILVIENVGNLVCPALFDLGETRRIVIVSTTEGTDKPLKYPTILRNADLCIINKVDLMPYIDFDPEQFQENAKRINPDLEFIILSATTGEGMEDWYRWIHQIRPASTGRQSL
jgi:hydrogenase nickel incorporation protein HypB